MKLKHIIALLLALSLSVCCLGVSAFAANVSYKAETMWGDSLNNLSDPPYFSGSYDYSKFTFGSLNRFFIGDDLLVAYQPTFAFKDEYGTYAGFEKYGLLNHVYSFGSSSVTYKFGAWSITLNYVVKYITKGSDKIFGKFFWSSKNIQREPEVILTDTDFSAVNSEVFQPLAYNDNLQFKYESNFLFLEDVPKCEHFADCKRKYPDRPYPPCASCPLNIEQAMNDCVALATEMEVE